MSSGLPFPVPWKKIPENIYLNMRFIYAVLRMPDVVSKRKALREKGLKDPINFFGIYRDDVPWITVTAEGASIPVDYIPSNVTITNPIVLSVAPAEEQDPQLVEWLKKKPTVLVNLGSTVAVSFHPDLIFSVWFGQCSQSSTLNLEQQSWHRHSPMSSTKLILNSSGNSTRSESTQTTSFSQSSNISRVAA